MIELDEAEQFYIARKRMNWNHRSKSTAMAALEKAVRAGKALREKNRLLEEEAKKGRIARDALAAFLGK